MLERLVCVRSGYWRVEGIGEGKDVVIAAYRRHLSFIRDTEGNITRDTAESPLSSAKLRY